MTAPQFAQWLADMSAAGHIRKGYGEINDAAALLGVSTENVRLFIKRGTITIQTDLACSALLHGLQPYP